MSNVEITACAICCKARSFIAKICNFCEEGDKRMLLLINACARPCSRTLALAVKAAQMISGGFETLDLFEEDIKPLDLNRLTKRDESIEISDYSDGMFRFAKQFANADEIVIAAPYWDLSFPAILKCYFESICVNGLTFRYTEEGVPRGLCRAQRLIYVTTAGGFIPGNGCGYDYVKQLCSDLFGIKNTLCIKAEGLDIQGADVEGILKAAETKLEIEI